MIRKALRLRLLRPELVKDEKINQGLLESVWTQRGECLENMLEENKDGCNFQKVV